MSRWRPGVAPLREGGYGVFETIIVFIFLSVVAVVVIDRYKLTVHEARETALRSELGNMRLTIDLFKMLRGRNPESLRELMTEKFAVPYESGVVATRTGHEKPLITSRYLEPHSLDDRMNILDPFGFPYGYDPKTGRVWSTKEGYEAY